MPIYATFKDIHTLTSKIEHAEQLIKEASTCKYPTVFLSHSSKDHDLLPVIIRILENHGGRVYIDDKDKRIPNIVTQDTARILRETINSCKKMVVLVSSNTKDSNWIPWELGLGDGKKTCRDVSLFPIVEYIFDTWAKQEYLGLYDSIVWGKFRDEADNQWLVWDHSQNTAKRLRDWIKQ